MGAYTPLPWAPDGLVDEVSARVLQPTVDEMARRGTPFSGLLYAGLALTRAGVRVVEFNARFGDPETQPCCRCSNAARRAAARRRHRRAWPRSTRRAGGRRGGHRRRRRAGYPESPRKGDPITGVDDADALDGVDVIHAGTARDGDGAWSPPAAGCSP